MPSSNWQPLKVESASRLKLLPLLFFKLHNEFNHRYSDRLNWRQSSYLKVKSSQLGGIFPKT